MYDMLLMHVTMLTYLPCFLLVRLRHCLDSTVVLVPFVVDSSFIILSVDYIERLIMIKKWNAVYVQWHHRNMYIFQNQM
jgi:hypothetical protein